ncbi:hypothetical protein FKW77_003824 [Venturia effusa]|uniref:Extracellular membrane protein CFEM domain-containing protein n=1 Tax=Venturia effusa TaxID=50376 RepID=A0A517LL89_9PEZI|nr:hypothetical protein FKW77_003824 [Venturia effusa]
MLPLTTHILSALALLLTILTTSVQATNDICPGYNYAVWHGPPQPSRNGARQFGVVNHNCDASATCPPGNPCTCSSFSCTPNPATINGFINHENLWFVCREDVRMGQCWFFNHVPGYAIEKCCRNDGKKNKERGLINDEQFEAINATNTLLDRHIEEYASALKKRAGDVVLVRERQKREMRDAEMREMAVGLGKWS